MRDSAVSLTGTCGVLAVLSAAGALSALGVLPAPVGTVAGAVLFLFGAALGPLVRISPVEPSLLKLATLSALTSPVLCGAAYVLLHLGLEADRAVAATFALALFASLLGVRARVSRPALSGAGRAALLLGVACLVVTGLLLFRGSVARASYHGLLHSALVLAADRGLPPDNPFLAGEPLAYYWYWHAQGALTARALALAPTLALALANAWAALVLPLALYFLVAPAFGEGRRELLGILLALFGLNALGGWLWVSEGFPWRSPESTLELLDVLRVSVGAWDPRLAFGFSKLGNLSSYPAALALLVGSWTSAAHALRHGARPWVGTTALLAGASLLVNPIVGGMAILVVGVAVVLFAPGLRARILLPLALCAAPGAFLALEAGRGYGGEPIGFVFTLERVALVLAPVSLLLAPALFGLRAGGSDGERRGRVIGLLLVATVIPLALAAVVELPYDNQYKLVRIGALPLGCLAAKGLFDLLDAGGPRRALAGFLGLALGGGVLANNALGFSAYLALSTRELPLAESSLALAPDPSAGGDAERARAYVWLASAVRDERPRPVLVVDVLAERPAVFGTHAFTDPVRNLQGHAAAAFTGMDLWCDRPSQALDARAGGLVERLEVVWRIYREDGELAPGDKDRILALGRPVLVLVSGGGTGYNAGLPDVARKLERAGFTRVRDFARESVLAWPADFAARLARAGDSQ